MKALPTGRGVVSRPHAPALDLARFVAADPASAMRCFEQTGATADGATPGLERSVTRKGLADLGQPAFAVHPVPALRAMGRDEHVGASGGLGVVTQLMQGEDALALGK